MNYYQLKRTLARSLRFNQEIYEDTVADMVGGGTVWVDAGCGRHILPAWRADAEQALVGRAGLVVGCDIDAASLKGHRTLKRLVVADLEQLPFVRGSVTLITSNMVVEHLRNPERVVAEFARVLSPGGRVVIHTPNAYSYFVLASRWLPRAIRLWLVRRLDGRGPDEIFPAFYRANTPRRLRQLMTAAGLVEERCRLVASDAVFGAVPLLAAMELLVIRLSLLPALRWMRVTILSTFSTPGRATTSDKSLPTMPSFEHLPEMAVVAGANVEPEEALVPGGPR